MITETSAHGSDEVRASWLSDSLAAIKDMRQRNIPIHGYMWFPMFTMIDWSYRFGRAPLEAYRLELGLYTLAPGGESRWRPTPLVEQYRGYISDPRQAIGNLIFREGLSNLPGR